MITRKKIQILFKPKVILGLLLFFVFISIYGCQTPSVKCHPIDFPIPTTDPENPWRDNLNPNIEIHQICRLSGHIIRGQTYNQKINDDLGFCLTPISSSQEHKNTGWEMIVGNPTKNDCGENFASIVTPPFRGNLMFGIEGWNFRNEENSSENDGSINAPQKERTFSYLLNQNDYDIAKKEFRCYQWKVDCPENTGSENSFKNLFLLPRSYGKFTITEINLGNLVRNDDPWIESMNFNAEFYLP
ncbi:MAG: hypothetical protein AB9891_05340 [Anaerolineaceae bacterium]